MAGLGRRRGVAHFGGMMIMSALALGVGLSGCGEEKKDDKKPEAAAAGGAMVSIAVVESAIAPTVIAGSGSVAAWQEAPVGAEVGGLTAVALLVDEGQVVKQGQPLLQMDDVLLKASYNQAAAQANQAQRAWERAQTIFQQGYLSQAGYDNAEAAHLTAQAALATAKVRLDQATVRAPISGVVTSRTAVLGQIVQSGSELFRIVRDGRIELNMDVTETDLHRIKAGMPATVSAENVGDVAGSVRIVTPAVDPGTRLGKARISVPWSSGLRPGMFATGRIQTGDQSALLVPQVAIVYVENSPGVFVVGDDGKAHFRKVVTGTRVGEKVAINEGLTAGERVVTTGAGFLVDADPVRVAAPAAAAEQ